MQLIQPGPWRGNSSRNVLFCLALSTLCTACDEEPRTDINANYKTPDMEVEVWANRFEVEGREVYDLRNEIVAAIGFEPGQEVADVGAGTGLFVPLLSFEVGQWGKVYAVDIIPKFIRHIEEKAAAWDLRNVETVLSTEHSTRLPDASVDKVFTSDAYHHFTYYEDMLASIHSALRPGGELIVLEYDIVPGVSEERMVEHVGGTKEEFTAQIEANGFRLVEDIEVEGMMDNFVRRFVKI